MIKDKSQYLVNNSRLFLLFIKPNYKSLINEKNYNLYDFNRNKLINILNFNKSLKNEFLDKKTTNGKNKNYLERCIKQISFIPKANNRLYNFFNENKIIFVEGIKAWEKYGVKNNNYPSTLFNMISKININDNFFSFQEKENNILLKILKSKIKKISFNKNILGSAYLCGLFFNKELDKMISVSVGNILYSILRETSRQKYEIIYISTEQYHDINIPYQLSSFNEDYKYLNIKYHTININDIIVIGNSKQILLSFINKINSKENTLYNIDISNNTNENYLVYYKINSTCNIDSLSFSSTASSF